MMRICTYVFCLSVLVGCKKSSQNKGSIDNSPIQNVEAKTIIEKEAVIDTMLISDNEMNSKDSMNIKMPTDSLKESNSSASVKENIENDVVKRTTKNKLNSNAKIKLDSIMFKDLVYEYDTITEGDIIKYKFEFENRNKKAIEVSSTYPDCGCTVPSFPFLALKNGDKGHIGVTYNSVGKNGDQESAIHVKFKGIKEERILVLKGFVKPKKRGEK